jgi:nucleotide-binding universal stress UspA family protein
VKLVLAANAQADQPWVAAAAAQVAKQTGASVAVLSVDELEVGAQAALPRSAYSRMAEEAAERAVQRLQAAGVEATKAVRFGGALEEIMDFAEQQQADLVIVGPSTRGPIATRLLGSVPLGLIQQSRHPVLVVTKPAEE